MEPPRDSTDPDHWALLTENDKAVYRRISTALSAPSTVDKRYKRIEKFTEIVDALENFINADETDRWKRCLVCGWCKFTDGVAINISQFKRLVFKCKSSISGSLKGMGYDIVLARPGLCQELFRQIPYLRDHPVELRQWTVRLRSGSGIQRALCSITPPPPGSPGCPAPPKPNRPNNPGQSNRSLSEDEVPDQEFPEYL
jgi:hypothetical protein